MASAPSASVATPGPTGRSRANARSSSPALSASAGGVCAVSSAGTRLPSIAAATPSAKKTASATGSSASAGTTPRKNPDPRSAPTQCTASSASAIARRQADEAPGHADQRAFGDDQHHEPPARHAEHAQQRELRAPPDHRERLRREHQQPAGEQRDQREHVEVDAIRARQAGARRDRRLGTRRPPRRAAAPWRAARANAAASTPGDRRRSIRLIRPRRSNAACAPAMSITARRLRERSRSRRPRATARRRARPGRHRVAWL